MSKFFNAARVIAHSLAEEIYEYGLPREEAEYLALKSGCPRSELADFMALVEELVERQPEMRRIAELNPEIMALRAENAKLSKLKENL